MDTREAKHKQAMADFLNRKRAQGSLQYLLDAGERDPSSGIAPLVDTAYGRPHARALARVTALRDKGIAPQEWQLKSLVQKRDEYVPNVLHTQRFSSHNPAASAASAAAAAPSSSSGGARPLPYSASRDYGEGSMATAGSKTNPKAISGTALAQAGTAARFEELAGARRIAAAQQLQRERIATAAGDDDEVGTSVPSVSKKKKKEETKWKTQK